MSAVTVPQKVNLSFIDQISYLEGYHRSGWPFVMRYLYRLNNSNATVYFDAYVDRTFHWLKPSIIPYTNPWIGVVHHTFDTDFSSYNCVRLLENPTFLTSLHVCKGLYVFTTALKDRWRAELDQRGYSVPVEKISHPTEFVNALWTPDNFLNNPSKLLVQVGAWLRDNYAIYRLNSGNAHVDLGNDVQLRKAALQGPYMEYYFKPPNFFQLLRPPAWKAATDPIPSQPVQPASVLYNSVYKGDDVGGVTDVFSPNADIPTDVAVITPSDDFICRDIVCRDSSYLLNRYVQGAVELLQDYDNSVAVIPTLDNASYDDLLAKNIIFLKLWDAGAVNTLLECVVRNVPIVVNRLPAVEELLGSDYPLYMDDLTTLPDQLTVELIMEAYHYLYAMDKTHLTGNYMLSQIVDGAIYSSL